MTSPEPGEMEDVCSAGAESKRREDAPSSAPGSDGGAGGMSILPLNGTKTRPLTAHALFCLRMIVQHPRPTQEINPGVVNRLLRGGLIRLIDLPSPYKTHFGRLITHAQATADGRLVAEAKDRP